MTDEDRASGCIYPDIGNIRTISLHIAKAVAKKVGIQGLLLCSAEDHFQTLKRAWQRKLYRRHCEGFQLALRCLSVY